MKTMEERLMEMGSRDQLKQMMEDPKYQQDEIYLKFIAESYFDSSLPDKYQNKGITGYEKFSLHLLNEIEFLKKLLADQEVYFYEKRS